MFNNNNNTNTILKIFLFILFLGTILESITFDSAFTVVTVINSVNPAHTQTTQEFGFKLGLYSKGPVHTLSTLISKRFNGDVNLNRPLDKTVNYDHDMADVTPGGLGYSGTMPVSDQLAMALPPHDHEGDGVSQIKERLASKAPSPKTRSLDDSVYKQVQGGFERGYDEGTGIEAEIYDGQALVTDEQVVGLEVVVDDDSKLEEDHHDGLEDGRSDETVQFIIGNGIITQEAYNEIIEISIPQALAEGVYLVEEDEYQPIEAHLDDGSDMQLDETVHHLANQPRVLISVKPSEAIQSGHNGRIKLAIPWTLVDGVCLVDDNVMEKDLDKLDMESDKTALELFGQTRVLIVKSAEVTGQDERDRTVAVFIPWTLADGVCLVGEEDLDKRDMPLDEISHNLSLPFNSADSVQVIISESATAISAVTSLAATPTGTLIGTSNTSDVLSSSPLFLGDSPSVSGEDIGRDLELTSDLKQTLLIEEQPLDYQPITTTNTTTDSIPAPLGTNSDDELTLNITTMATTKKFNFNFMELIAYFTQGEQPRAVAPLDSRTRRKILFQCIFSLIIAALVQLPTPPQQWVEFIRQHPFSTAAATLPLDQFDIQQWFTNIKNTLEHENSFGFGLLSVIVVTVIVVVLENIWSIYVLYCFVVAGILVPGYLGLGLALGGYCGLRYPFGDFEVPVVDEDGEEEVQEEVTLVEEELMEEAQERCTTEAKDSEEASSEVQPKEAQAPIPEVQEEVSLESTVRVAQVQVKPRFKPLLAIEDNKHKTTFKDNRHQIDAQLDARWKRLVENATNSGFNDQDAESSGKKKKPNFNWSTKMAVPEPCNIYMRPVKVPYFDPTSGRIYGRTQLIAWVYTAMDIDHPDHGDKPWFDPHFRERANKINVNHTEHGPFSFTSFRVSYHIVEVPEGTVIHRLCEQMLATSVWGNARLSMDFKVKMTSPALLEVPYLQFVERTMTPADEKKGEKVRFVFRPNKYDVAMGRLDDDGWFNVTMGKDEISMPKIRRGQDWIRCYWIGKK